MGCKISKSKYADYEIAPTDYNEKSISSIIDAYELAFKLEQQYYSSVKVSQKKDYVDVFDEIKFEINKQQKALKSDNLFWIIYDQFDNISYHSNSSNSFNYSAKWKSADLNKSKDWKVLLKELNNSSHMTQNDLKLIVAEIECDKKNSTQVYGISQNPKTLNYVIVMDYLSSKN
ncbi:unnamed protein product [Rhizophagus irregularis]|uniref:Uncharacterized protein n=4 Tax=Rhizophagus irregularis TaxID=588596 RepID=U9US73_RHIID|nr:hypothetical protein GLOIN_2v1661445 [Rhizophagus irregularis DAOM 181602=DAOM 197198]EXX50431.1 hypothetical protein RirG_270920 [Rhizophagus irregularis DAOM 197198w]UZO19821.1 hypothetical protein OCT59_011092 [Rhizophagus irregularis]POG65941.1 hypothetical protein GLOIN_2v1661445 [Rhizophagus irregularis DAOM 181602=DAOM 197198]CAB4413787.1 unnamed protein product [Rhizophagus irregularis]CAB4489497.1 unnamed protein product [Rhizophagus irregularis]|eukprot:XP_025172807.1 hypothetical protein GLOIN_2v1661445 [Rhizophagus irregularis DAOM 181602=DAOM 197198]